MKRILAAVIAVLSLAACGGPDADFAPHVMSVGDGQGDSWTCTGPTMTDGSTAPAWRDGVRYSFGVFVSLRDHLWGSTASTTTEPGTDGTWLDLGPVCPV